MTLKKIYKVVILFLALHMAVLTIHALNVFPAESRLYSDVELGDIENLDALGIIGYFLHKNSTY